jgi:hypothetical protein
MAAYLPTEVEVNNAKTSVTSLSRVSAVFEPVDYHIEEQFLYDLATDNDVSIGEAPEPEPGSRQLKGETVEEFSNRMESDKLNLLNDFAMPETISMVSSKEADARRLADDDTILGPTMGRAMYVWVDCPHGYRLRKLVPREEWSTC